MKKIAKNIDEKHDYQAQKAKITVGMTAESAVTSTVIVGQ